MDATIKALDALLIQAIPTIVFFLFLAAYLKYIFFKPMARMLEQRRKETEGVRELAQRALEEADKKTSQFERAMQLARAEIAQENEVLRRQWSAEQTEIIERARVESVKQVEEAKLQMAKEIEQAKSDMDTSIDRLSSEIVQALVRRRAA
ncbi:MAG TPA: ATP synthase F0 subunit B [Bryobacteraceae bacterium]|nr:ATP synthase F0 subunit B [Bryobacteraceae bacterium]